MKYLFTIFLSSLLLVSLPTLAQESTKKTYVARVKAGSLPPKDLKRRNDEIKFQARNKVSKNLLDLLNTLTADSLGESERNAVIQNSYLPNTNQVFYGDDVVIEDDIDPVRTSPENAVDVPIEKYLRNLDLFYAKSGTFSITFSQIIVSDVQEGKEYPYIKVFFTSSFGGKHNQIATPYRPVNRVAELRAEKVDGKWRTFITRLAFLRPGEALTQLSKPVIDKGFGPKQPIDGQELVFRRTDGAADSLSVKWDRQWLNIVRSSIESLPTGYYQRSEPSSISQDNVSVTLSDRDQRLTFKRIDGSSITFGQLVNTQPTSPGLARKYRRLGWLQIATGVAALAASYAGYSSLQNSYKAYEAKLTNLNAEYAIWQSLSRQPGGSRGEPMSFSSFANPGIYAVYGGGAVGSAFIINGLRYLGKARKLSR